MKNIEKLFSRLLFVAEIKTEEKDGALCDIIKQSTFFKDQGRFCSLDCATCKALFLYWLLKEETY